MAGHQGFGDLGSAEAQGLGVLRQQLGGGGAGLEAFGELGQALLRDIEATGGRAARGIESRAAISGTGRTGATAAQKRGLQSELGRLRATTLSGLGVEEAQLRQQTQSQALEQLLALRAQIQNEQFEQERLELMRQDLERQGQVGIGDVIGEALGFVPFVGPALRGISGLFSGGSPTSLPAPLPPLGGGGGLLPNLTF